MRIFGLEIGRVKEKALNAVSEARGGWHRVMEYRTGAWQQNVTLDYNSVLANFSVFACATLIANDIAKLPIVLKRKVGKVWTEVEGDVSPLFERPNSYQTKIQFMESWVLSKLLRGNAYILKEYDSVGRVKAMHVLNPNRVLPLISDSGEVFYQLQQDTLYGLFAASVVVPARYIIHDRFNCIFHPLVGTSPIFANGLAATEGLRIMENSTNFFSNRSMPGGFLVAPGSISDTTAARLKTHFETNYSGENAGKIAVLGDGLKFEPLAATSRDSQLIEQLKWTAEVVCSTFHVPPYKIGIGTMPAYNNVQALNVEYYSQALQGLIESVEALFNLGFDLPKDLGVELDLDALLRMDSVTQMSVLKEAVGAAVMAPNEAREKVNLPPVKGGESPMIQEQNYSLEALADRDRKSVQEVDVEPEATAMNGAQITALQGLIVAAAIGQLPKETLRATIAAAYPALSSEEINSIVDPIVLIEVAPPDTPALPAPAPDETDEPAEDEDEPEPDAEDDEAELGWSYVPGSLQAVHALSASPS